MKRLSTGVLAAISIALLGATALSGPAIAQSQGNIGNQTIAQDQSSAPAANFGSPPSGQIPILYNDHHVYAKPDELKQGRVLAALVRGGTVLIPLRSMFEQMGATVAYDPASKTVDVSKPGADVKVTVGRPEVVINGESRPLDVPPEIYQGHVVVPVRVISEGMGAYVQWVPDQRVVVVRYLPPTPPPPAPTAAPTEVPTATPAPVATPFKDAFIAGDYIFSPKVYNEFSPGNKGDSSYTIRGAWEFDAFSLPWMVEGDFRQYSYPHNAGALPAGAPTSPCVIPGDEGCVTVIGGGGQTYVPGFEARNQDFDGRIGLKVADPRIYVGVGYLYAAGNYGYPKVSNWGFGAEKLPDLNQTFSLYGSLWYYPNVKGNYRDSFGNNFNLAYNVLKYQIGGDITFANSPVFIDLGWLGEHFQNKSNAPGDQSFNGPYAGLGIKF